MSQIDEEEADWKRYMEFLISKVQLLSEYFRDQQTNPVDFGVFGSTTEELKCCLPNDVGDIDIMVYSISEEAIVDESIMECFTSNPVFVHLRGKDHPVLQHCLVENSVFVATSTLKEFHPKVFGNARHLLMLLPTMFAKVNQLDPSGAIASTVLENPRGPSIQLNLSHSFGSITDQIKHLGDTPNDFIVSDDFRNFCEWFAVVLNPSRTFTEEHSACVDEYLKASRDESQRLSQNPSVTGYISTLNELMSGEKLLEIKRKVQDLDYRLSEKNTECTASPNNKSTKTAESSSDYADNSQKTVEEDVIDESAIVSFAKTTREEDIQQDTESCIASSKEDPQARADADCLGATRAIAEKPTLADGREDPQVREVENALQEKLAHLLVESIFGGSLDLPGDSTREEVNHLENEIQSGIDLVPAFIARGWPQVARTWLTRGRAWPSPQIISKVLENGFHLVVKTPKDSDRQDLFRLSFSRAELILSGELNDIQRQCYRCLKLYYRSVFQQEHKIITSYCLKTILFWTAEETGLEIWNEVNRGFCVMMLLEKLHKSLETKFLPHYFIPEFNLLEEAVSDYPHEVQYLADEVMKIYENPLTYPNVGTEQTKSRDKNPPENTSMPTEEIAAARAPEREMRQANHNTQLFIKYQDFLNLYKEICRELLDLVLQENSQSNVEDPTVKSIIDNLRPISSKMGDPEVEMMAVLECSSQTVYSLYVVHGGRSPRERILSTLKGQCEMLAYVARQDDLMAVDSYSSSDDCDYLVTYVAQKDSVAFELSSKNEYAAFGLNNKPSMEYSTVPQCSYN
ncbi:hypothetical protein QZH41_005956 [Actinostola sp. cb2023]|nr:hypothetical protein QZH41_005956 [Actinostola sp. cb2023]